MNIIDIILIISYLVFMLYLGFYASKKQNSMEDFYLGGKKTGTISMMCLWLSSWVGGAAIVATAANAYELGITAVWYVGAMCVGFAVFGLTFTTLIKKVGDKFSHITYPDLIEDRYDSRCRMVSIITTILANIAYNAGQLVAAGGILYTFTGWNITFCIILSAVVVSIYTATGGLLAVTYTDVAQTVLILGSLVIVIPFIYKASGSITNFPSQFPPSFFKLGAWGTSTILGFIVSITLTFFTSMDSYTRCFAAKDERSARNGTLLAIIGTAFIAIVSTYIGMAGRIIFPNIGDTSAILPTIISNLLPTGVKGIMLIGIISALMSTSDISTLTASANITRDIYQRYINPKASERHLLNLGTISSMLIGALSTIMAIKMMNIVNILYLAFTINSAGLFLPTIGIFFWKKANSKSAFWSMTLSLSTVVLWFLGNNFNLGPIFNIDPLWPGLLVSALVFIPMSLITKPSERDKEKIEKYLSHNKIN
ncbi:sodium:solute symporter family protein [Tissierella sp. MB52-C2]|uniref:sodium:solute symporter family protein n=1 Tax=Tissierella sp. MB52-C2 TaxID=3070999 RepID=UPI00280B58F4|nr:sodium:solute symporter family protein [Tissierella sp. MB52-C2]WMM24364.1 sodium:solute symporter family protein [Tissierella sp. MB52-C2]